ncbi:MAG TPA: hypothetical protein VKU85_00080, partial [bacterium]|nr:hypothetical protein [bacterium]
NAWPASRGTVRVAHLDLETGVESDVLTSTFRQWDAMFSPDAQWIAYNSQESGETEVCISPFPQAGRRWQISTGGGRILSWSADGKEILYLGESQVWRVAVDPAAPDLAPSVPEPLFAVPPQLADLAAVADHTRFLASVSRHGGAPAPLRIIRNWSAAR